jgi:hypothetical protein
VKTSLRLGDLHHDHGLGLGQAAVLDDDPLHRPRLGSADVHVGLGGPAQDVGEAGQVARLLGRHRFEAGHDPADRLGLARDGLRWAGRGRRGELGRIV